MNAKHIAACLAVASLYGCAALDKTLNDTAEAIVHKPDVAADYFYAVCERPEAERADIMKEFNVAIAPHFATLVCGPSGP